MNDDAKPKAASRPVLKTLYLAGQIEEYIQRCRDNVAFTQLRIGERSMSTAIALQDLADGYQEAGDDRQSYECNAQAATIIDHRHGRKNAAYSSCLVAMASCLTKLGRIQEAEVAYREAITNLEHLPDRPEELWVTTLTNLAALCVNDQRFSEATHLLDRASSTSSKPTSSAVHTVFARMHLAMGNLREAERNLGIALRAQERASDTNSRRYGMNLLFMGRLTDAGGRQADAARYYSAAADVFRNTRPPSRRQLDECLERIDNLGT